MILSIVVLFLFTAIALIITLPYLLVLYLRSAFSTVHMKLYSPFSLRGLLVNGPTSSWGLSHFTLFVSAIELGWSPQAFKLRLNFANVQIYLSRRMASLCPVNLIEGNQEASILYNFAHLLFQDLAPEQNAKQRASKVASGSKTASMTTLAYFLEGILHLFLIFVMRTFQIVVSDCRVFIVSGIPEKLIDFGTEQSKKESLMLMQCLSEYSVNCDLVKIDEQIEHHNKYRLAFSTQTITADSFNHYDKKFIELENVEMQLIIPYSMSLRESLQQMKFIFRISSASVNIVVADFEHFFQLVREVIFDVNSRQEPQQQIVNEKEVCLYVGSIRANLREIFQAEFDNSEAKEYLSNVCDSNLELEQFCLEEHTFSIAMSTLSIVKFCKLTSNEKELKILTIPNLQILSRPGEETIEILHEDVVVDCQSEEVAFFGKIFSLINERIRFENYNEEIYRDLKANYQPQGTLVSQIEGLVTSSKVRQEEVMVSSQLRKLVYSPKKLVVLLKMKKLSHVITIEGFSYCRYRNLNEMSHEISITRLSVDHKSFKEFLVNDFSLTFSETTAEKQLSMAIKDIIMQQSEETLIDYLDSFTLFKHLLQFESDEQQKPAKLFKKYIFIDQITVHFDNEQLSLNSLKIDKEASTKELMNSLYFSIQRCQIVLAHLKHNQKDASNTSHVLFAIESLSLRTINEERGSKIKPKATLIVKGPTFNLPSNNVSSIILSYIKVYSHLESHIEAFIINVTNEKLKALKYHFKEFFIEPDQLTVIVTSLSLCISDKRLDSNLIAFNKTIREYLFYDPKFNEAELLTILRRNNKTIFPLLSLAVDSINIEASPLAHLQPTEKSVNEWIAGFEALNEEASRNNTEIRCRRIRAERLEVKLRGVSIRIRDYASPIFSCKEVRARGQRLMIRKIIGSKMNYIKGEVAIGETFVSLGLGQLSGWQEISRRMSELDVINETFQREFQGKKEELTVWHRIIGHYKWRLQLSKDIKTKIQILTGDTPYNGDKFELEIGRIYGESTTRKTYLAINQLELFLKEFQMVRMPRLEVSLQVKLRGTELDVFLLVKMAELCSLSIASWIISYLEELVQLKKDWLLIYGIYQREVKRNILHLEDIQNMTYLEIASLLAQQQSNEKNSNSVLNYLNHFQCRLSLRHVSFAVVEHDLQLSLEASDIDAFLVLQPDHDLYNQLKVRRSKITCRSLSLAFNKAYNMQSDTLRETKIGSVGDRQVVSKHYQFFRCDNLVVNFNWYFSEGQRMGLANQWIYVETLTGQISKRMERYCNKMKSLLTINSIGQNKQQEKRYERPINKFRKIVLEIIQINRRRKILRGHIKKYNTVVNLQRYKLLLKSEEKMMTLEGRERGLFFQRIQYGQEDKYHSQPCEILTLMFPTSTIMLSSESEESGSFEMMRAGQLTLEIQMSDQKIDQGKLLFEDINIELGLQGKNILENIITFVIDIVNSNEERRKMYNIETAKYEQLVNNGAGRIKQKIEWKQSDIRRKEKEIFQWNFVLKNVAVIIRNHQTKILSAKIDKAEMIFHLFGNLKIERKIVFKWLQIYNELEPLESEYRKILQLGRDNVGMAIISDTYEVNAFSEVLWSYHKQLSFWVEPMKLRLTEEMLKLFIEFVGSSKPEEATNYDQIKEYKNKTPDYFKLCSIEPVNIQLWLRSPNIFKNMEAIKVHLEKYELKEKFYTQQELGRAIGFWLIKQIGSQIFSLLGQKLFGDDEQ